MRWRSAARTDEERRRKILLLSIVANLGVLGIFKYFNFFADSLVQLAATFGLTVSPITLQIVLPVGISFYTFQSMSYTIDVYRRHLEPCRRLEDFALYVAFFPQLVAGPIERATTLIPQITAPRIMTSAKIGSGLSLIALGFFKKVVMADNLAPTVNAIFAKTGGYTAEEVIVAAVLFAFQIYGDFSGYTDIARGTARILGFELMPNFREPYFAPQPQRLLESLAHQPVHVAARLPVRLAGWEPGRPAQDLPQPHADHGARAGSGTARRGTLSGGASITAPCWSATGCTRNGQGGTPVRARNPRRALRSARSSRWP